MTCFYCGVTLSSNRGLDWTKTNDHIYPRSLLAQLTQSQKDRLPSDFGSKNIVSCCIKCNAYKGRLHPLDWLVIMPNNHSAARLAERMVAMGEEMAEVFDALQRRKK